MVLRLISKILIDETGDGGEREDWAMMCLVRLSASLMGVYAHRRQVECFRAHCRRQVGEPGYRRLELDPIS